MQLKKQHVLRHRWHNGERPGEEIVRTSISNYFNFFLKEMFCMTFIMYTLLLVW